MHTVLPLALAAVLLLPSAVPAAHPLRPTAQLSPVPGIEDAAYAARAIAAGRAIAEAGRLAAERGHTAAVRAVGADAAAAQDGVAARLAETVRARGAEPPDAVDGAWRDASGRMAGLEGVAFDRAVLGEILRLQEEALAAHLGYLQAGGDPALRDIAAEAAGGIRARTEAALAAARGLRTVGEAATSEAPPGPGPGTIAEHIGPDAVIGRPVLDADGEEIGTVADVVLGASGAVEALVVDAAGTGGETRRVAIPFGRVRIGTDRPELRTPEITRDDVAEMPEHRDGGADADGRGGGGGGAR
jgi:predicted outer membrane protein